MLVSLRHRLSDRQCKVINDHYDQHLTKAKAFRDTYNANIKEAEKEWRGMGQNFRDQILSCLESRAQLSLFSSHTYLDMRIVLFQLLSTGVTTLQLTAARHLLLQDTSQGPGVWCVLRATLKSSVLSG